MCNYFLLSFFFDGLSKDFFGSIVSRKLQGESILAWAILLGTIPVGLAGLFFKDAIELNLRTYQVVAFATIFLDSCLVFQIGYMEFLGEVETLFVPLIS